MGILTAPGRGGFGKDRAASLDPFKKVFQARTVLSVLRRVLPCAASGLKSSLRGKVKPRARLEMVLICDLIHPKQSSVILQKGNKTPNRMILNCFVCKQVYRGVLFVR